ncbi:MAG: hypothetical protein OXG22_10845, partial [Chloroflexi bacterium]|nr:hypothetical protein [Chloroflexota bacterium]
MVIAPAPGASAQTTPQAVPQADVHVVPADWALKPSSLGPGDRFRLMFRTTSRWAATATDIATYDGYVQSELTKSANTLTAIKPYASGFKMVGSTQAANLRDHLDFRHGGNWRTGVPIYWMDDEGDGGLVANDYQDFCNEEQPWRSSTQPAEWWRAGTLADHRNENGAPHADSNHPWTGSENSCATRTSNYLGATRVEIGRHREPGRFYGPLSNTQDANTATRSMYAMSPEFIVAGPIHVSLSASDAIMTEGSSTDTATVVVSLSRSLAPGETLTATFHSHSLFLGGDYTLALDGTPAGVTLNTTNWTITFSGANAPRAVTLIGTAGANSVATSGTETKPLYFTGVSGIAGATYDGQNFATALFIKSTSATGRSITLTVSPERVAEGGTVTVTVDMSSTRSSAIIVQVNIPGLRSTHGVTTVTAVSGSVTQIWDNLNVRIAGNTTQARFTFVIPDDNNAEQAQPLTALFLDIADNNLQPGSAVQDWFTIEPSDHTAANPLVKIGLPVIEGISRNDYDQQVREENQSPLSFTVTANPAPSANKDVCVDVVETGGNRVSAANEGRRTVTILANSMTGTLSVPFTDTAVDEPDGAITATVVGGTGCTGYTVSTEEPIDEALIKDGEATLVSLTSDDSRMTEGDATDTAVAKLALSRPLNVREMIEVRLTLTTATGARLPGHATPDFAVAAQGTGVTVEGLTSAEPKLFFTGSASETVQEATITITPVSGLDDGDTGHEIITMALVSDSVLSGRGLATTVSGGVGRGSDFSLPLVLTDDEGGALPVLTVSVVGGHGHIAEGGTRRIRIQSDQTALPGGIAIGNLASGSSYSSGYAGAVPSSATIPSGSTSVDFDISVTDNSADAAYGTLTWTLPMNDAVYSRGDPHSVSLVIADDEIGASIPKPEVYEFPYLKWHLPSFYYLPRAKILADGRRTLTSYEDPPTRKADGSINTDDYYWHRDLYVQHDPNRNNPMYYYFWFHPGYQPTGPVTLTVKAVDHQNNANAETGRVAFALDLDLTAPPYGENGPFTDDELTVTLNPEDLVRHSGGAVHFRPGFAIYVNPRVYNECVDITHTLSGGGYGSVTVETMRVHLSPQGEMGPTDRTNTACGSPGLLDSELRTTGRQGGYAWTTRAIDLTGSRDAPVQPPTVRLAVGQYWVAQRDGESGNPIREGQYATFTVRYIGDIYEPVTVKYTVSQTGDVIDTARFNPHIQHSVTIPASSYFSGAVSFDIPTKGDNVTEPDGSITARLVADSAYISTANSITVQVTDGGGRVGMNSPPQPPQPDTNGQPQIQGGPGDENGNPVGPGGSNAPPSDAIGSNAPPSTDSDGSGAPPSDAIGSGGSSTPTPKPAGWPHGLAQLPEGGDSEIITISLGGGALGENQEVVATLRSSGATPLDDYTLTLDSASSPGVSVSRTHPLNAAESRITFGPGAERAVLWLRAIGDHVEEYERLTLTVTGTVYFDGSDTTNIPVNRSLEFAIMDGAAPDAELAEAERLILAMIERHRNVTGNARALANWEEALRTILSQEGGFTIEELEEHAASVQAGKPTERWALVLKVAKKLDALRQQQAQQATPEISVTAGSGVTEGGSASFTITADPAPASPLAVSVSVAQSGDYAASGTTGAQTVTIPTSGSVSHTVATINDDTDEADGSVTLTLKAGDGYTVSSSNNEATVAVSDDDVPEISVTAGSGITEGGSASFTVTADPAPASPLSVSLT